MFDAKFVSGLIVATGLAVASPATLAYNENYFGINFASVKYTADFYPGQEPSLPVLYGRVGTRFDENFSIECRLGIGIGDDPLVYDDGFNRIVFDLGVSNFAGGFIRVDVREGEDFAPYLMGGFTRVTLKADVEVGSGVRGSAEASDSDFSFGIGADIKIAKTLSANIEYMNYYDNEFGVELKGWAIGITQSF